MRLALTYSVGVTQTSTENPASPVVLSLATAEQGHSYCIVSSTATERNRMRMDSLGLIPGDVVHVLLKNFAGLVIAIKGSRLAVSRSLAALLTVQEQSDDDWQPDGTS